MRLRSRCRSLCGAVAALTILGAALGTGGCGTDETGVKTYTDPVYGYSFEYPADWILQETDSAELGSGAAAKRIVQVGDPDGAQVEGTGLDGLVVRVYELNYAVDETMLDDVKPEMDALIADLLSQDASWEVQEPLTQVTVGQLPGFKATFTFDWDAGHPVKTSSQYLFFGDVEYELAVQAALENWEADQAVFDAFLASFKPGSGD